MNNKTLTFQQIHPIVIRLRLEQKQILSVVLYLHLKLLDHIIVHPLTPEFRCQGNPKY